MIKYVAGVLIATMSLLSANAQNQAYSFFIAGHTYGKPGVDNVGVHPPFKAKFPYIQSRSEIKFGVFTGDMVYQASPEDWDEVDVDIDALGLPIYFAPGNHDGSLYNLYQNRYGVGYEDFLYENDLFIILNANGYGWNINATQLNFIDSLLDIHVGSVNRIFVFFHQLLWLDNPIYKDVKPNSYQGKDLEINFWTEVEPRFHHLPHEVVMCAGDIGASSIASDFMFDNYDNITFIASGMGKGIQDNMVVLNIDTQKNISYDLICLNGSELNCFGDLEDYIIRVGTSEWSNESEFNLYPNPTTHGVLHIQVNTIDSLQIVMRNMLGQVVLSETFAGQSNYQISTDNFQNGMYLIEVTQDGQVNHQSVMIR